MRRLTAAAALMMFAWFWLPVAVSAAPRKPAEVFQGLKSTYLTLRNTDVELKRIDEWRALAREFTLFADKNSKAHEAASALYNASILYEEMYRRFGDQETLLKSCALLERLARHYPGHPLADDALVKRGDLYRYELRDEAEAGRAYQEVIQAYADSDMYDIARQRIANARGAGAEAEPEQPRASRAKRAGTPVIVVDPGHGGEDFGAPGQGGLLEKDVVLSVAFKLEKLLKERLKADVYLTRRKDVFVPLADRTAFANEKEADLFVSLHANSSPGAKARGLEIYYLDNTGSQATRKLAERENSSVRFEGPDGDLRYMLSDLIQNAKLDDSIILGHTLQDQLFSYLAPRFPGLRKLQVKRAPFFVLVGAHMPCVLVEMFFIDNESDGRYLAQSEFRSALAQGLFIGIDKFLKDQGIGMQ